jgi:putative transposase
MSELESSKKAVLLDKGNEQLSIRRQCELLAINRSNYYYVPHPRQVGSLEYKEEIMQRLDHWNTYQPTWGVKKLVPLLAGEGYRVSHELVREMRAKMGLETIYPKENTSKSSLNARKLPYLLSSIRAKGMIWLPNLVWAIDITYISMERSHMYLTALIDWYSRYIVGWELSDTLETAPVLNAVKQAIRDYGYPAFLNSDQGVQFTSCDYMTYLVSHKIKQSMDGKGRWADNVIIERWFRTLKIENIYINEYTSPRELRKGISKFIKTYNYVRPHQSLAYQTPHDVYTSCFKKNNDGISEKNHN